MQIQPIVPVCVLLAFGGEQGRSPGNLVSPLTKLTSRWEAAIYKLWHMPMVFSSIYLSFNSQLLSQDDLCTIYSVFLFRVALFPCVGDPPQTWLSTRSKTKAVEVYLALRSSYKTQFLNASTFLLLAVP